MLTVKCSSPSLHCSLLGAFLHLIFILMNLALLMPLKCKPKFQFTNRSLCYWLTVTSDSKKEKKKWPSISSIQKKPKISVCSLNFSNKGRTRKYFFFLVRTGEPNPSVLQFVPALEKNLVEGIIINGLNFLVEVNFSSIYGICK